MGDKYMHILKWGPRYIEVVEDFIEGLLERRVLY